MVSLYIRHFFIDIMLRLRLCRVVIVNDFELAKEMANDENFSHRLQGHIESNVRGIDGNQVGEKTCLSDT